jgi:hypothetical protein
MRKLSPVVVAIVVTVALPLAFVAAPFAAADEAASGPTASASIVRVDRVKAPKRKVVHRHFVPWAHPGARGVLAIIRAEARRWGIDPRRLANRVACESHYHWWAGNGQYQGVLQFGWNAFYRGVRSMHDRNVKLVRSRMRTVHDARIVHFADGRIERRNGRPRKQRVFYVYTGKLPRRPGLTHAWAQLRIGAQAIRGISAVHSSEWTCGA